MTAKVLGIPTASPSNRVRTSKQRQLGGEGSRQVTPWQMELARLRAELARATMVGDTAKRAAESFAQEVLQSTPVSAR